MLMPLKAETGDVRKGVEPDPELCDPLPQPVAASKMTKVKYSKTFRIGKG
jgi:hypothetical protein